MSRFLSSGREIDIDPSFLCSYPPESWTTKIAGTIKGLSSQLVMDGSDGFVNYTTKATAPGLNVADVDIMSDHGYPRSLGILNSEIPLAADANKVSSPPVKFAPR